MSTCNCEFATLKVGDLKYAGQILDRSVLDIHCLFCEHIFCQIKILFIFDDQVRVDRRHAATMRERKRLRKVNLILFTYPFNWMCIVHSHPSDMDKQI